MAIAYVNGATLADSGSAATTATITYSPTAGNDVIITLANNGTISTSSCADSSSRACIAGPTSGAATNITTFYFHNVPAGVTSYTLTWTTSRRFAVTIVEYSGVNSYNLSGANANAAATPITITTNTTRANSYLVCCAADLSATHSANTGSLRQSVRSSASVAAICGDNTVATAGSITWAANQGTSGAWGLVVLELFASGSVIAAVGGANNNSASNVTTLTVTRTVTNGNIVVLFIVFSGAVSSLVVKDNNNVTLNAASSQPNLFCYYYTAGAGVTSFTATWTTGVQVSMAVEEYSGAAGVDNNFTYHSAATSNSPTQAVTLIASNDWAVCGLAASNTITGTVGNQRQQTTAGSARLTLMDNTVASASSVSCTGSMASSVGWLACGVILGGASTARVEQDVAIAVIQPTTSKARVEQDLTIAVIKPTTARVSVEQDVMMVVVSNTIFPVVPVTVRPQLCINT